MSTVARVGHDPPLTDEDVRPDEDRSGRRHRSSPLPLGAEDPEAEEVIAGAAIMDVAVHRRLTADGIGPEHFHRPRPRHAWIAIGDLDRRGAVVNHETVAHELERTGVLEKIGGPGIILGLRAAACLPGSVDYFAASLGVCADKRRLAATLRAAQQELTDGVDPAEVAKLIAGRLDGLGGNRRASGDVSSWAPVDLGPVVSGERSGPVAGILFRSDGLGLLYPGRTHGIVGESEAGKSWLAQLAVVTVLQAGGRAVIVDFEDDAPALVSRLLALGATTGQILGGLTYLRPDEALSEVTGHLLDEACNGATVVVLDGTTDAMAVHGWAPKSDIDVAAFQRQLLRRMTHGGAAVVAIDHVVKDREQRGRYATGSQHKLAGIDGAQYLVELRKPWAPGRSGVARIVVGKDRPGMIRAGLDDVRTVGDMTVTAWPDGGVRIEVNAPQVQEDAADGGHRPTFLMERVSKFLAAHQGKADPSTNGVRKGVKGDSQVIDRALVVLELEGYATSTKAGNGTYWTHVKPFTYNGEEATENG